MNFSFNYYRQFDDIELYLCNPDGRELFALTAYDRVATLRFNDLSKIEFKVPKTITQPDGTNIVPEYYNYLETKRIISVPKIGFFQISKVQENDNGTDAYKAIEAESLQSELKDRGVTLEERVYCFYNPNDPYDDTYNPVDEGALPSVMGQAWKQLGIAQDLHNTPEEPSAPYDTWTIVYINPSLYYGVDESICRTFKEQTIFGYDFLANIVEEAFNVVVLFDFETRAIYVKSVAEITERANLCLSFSNFMNNIEIEENASEIVTVLNCQGNNLNILSVNPTGTSYIVDFSYYMDEVNHRWMSTALINKLKQWQQDVENSRDEYRALVQTLRAQYASKTQIDTQLRYASVRVQDLERAASQYAEYQNSGDDDITPSTLLGIVMAENVDVGVTSLLPSSPYYSTAFSGSTVVTAYQSQPIFVDGEFIFYGSSQTDTVDNLCAELADDDTAYLYFQDGDTSSYCKLKAKATRIATQSFAYTCAGFERYIAINGVHSQGYGETRHSADISSVTLNATTFMSAVAESGVATDILKNKYMFLYTADLDTVGTANVVFTWQYNGENVTLSDWGIYYTTSGLNNWSYIEVKLTPDVIYWKQLQEANAATLQSQSDTYQALINSTSSSLNAISSTLNILNYFTNTPALLKELGHYWIEGDYTNENYATLESTTMAEEIDLANELMEAGYLELSKVSQPRFSFSASAENLLGCYEFRSQTNELELGKIITIEKEDGVWYYPALLEMEFAFDETDSFSLTFANATRLDDWGYTFADMVTASSQTSRQVNANWQNLMGYTKNKSMIDSLIRNPLNATLQAAMSNTSNQEFNVSDTGILGRKSDGDGGFGLEQVRLINNLLMFTDDGWKTAKTALGKIYYSDGQRTVSSYGIIAETIIGEMILGETLKIINSTNSFTIDDEGMNFNDNFIVDAAGNVQLNGSITWGTDASPVQVLYAYGSITKPTDNTAWASYPSTSETGWHRIYNSGVDFFMSCTYDGGHTWTTAIRFAGQNGEPGDDGDSLGSVYLYHRATRVSTPTYVNDYNTNISTYGWTAAPQGTSATYLYEYVLPYSEVKNGTSGATTYTRVGTPVIWAKYGSDASVTSENVFAALTDDAQRFGVFSNVNNSLYINANYINSGTITVSSVYDNTYGTVFSANASTGIVTLSGWTAGELPSNTHINGIYNTATINGTAYIYGLQASQDDNHGIFFVKRGGTMSGDATFYVLPSGFMCCTSGKIGNWQIDDSNRLIYDTANLPSGQTEGSGAWQVKGGGYYSAATSSAIAVGINRGVTLSATYALSATNGLHSGTPSYGRITFSDTSVSGNSGKDIFLNTGASGGNCIYLNGRPILNSYGYGGQSDMTSISNPRVGQLFFVI